MGEYRNAKIYRVVCHLSGLEYIGSTINPLSQRLREHRADYLKSWNDKKRYVSVFEIIANGNHSIHLLENFPCGSRDELRERERYWIERRDCVNLFRPIVSAQEHWALTHSYIPCPCGRAISYKHYTRHCRSKRHKRLAPNAPHRCIRRSKI